MRQKPNRLISRAAMMLLMMLLTTTTAWANDAISYIDENGVTQTITDYYVLTGSETPNDDGKVGLNQDVIVVNSNVTYDKIGLGLSSTGNEIKLILCDGKTLTINSISSGYRQVVVYNNLTIYGQTNNSGKLVVNATNQNAIEANNCTVTVNGGTIESTSTHSSGRGLLCSALVFNGGNLKLEGNVGVQCKRNTVQTVTLNWRSASDRVFIRNFDPNNNTVKTVNIGGAGGKCFTDGNGNYYGGTYTSGFSAFSGKELQPATAYTLTLPDGVTASGALFTDSGVDYYAPGSTVTLSDLPAAAAGYLDWQYTVNGTPIDGTSFTMPASNTTVALTHQPDPDDFELTATDEYTIHTADGWGVFCDALQDNDTYNRFSGKTVKLGGDIGTAQDPITRMAGSQYHDFCGTFDGQGYTLQFTSNENVNGVAPFSYVSETTPTGGSEVSHPAIRNLNVVAAINTTATNASGLVGRMWGTLTIEDCTVGGTIQTSNQFAAGFIAEQNGDATISNCRSSVTINSSISGDGTHGGFVAVNNKGSNLTIEGCVFDGKLLTTNGTIKCGGFIGWRSGAAVIRNSLYAPASPTGSETWVGNSGSATFARNGVDTYNCYYTTLFCDGNDYVPSLTDGTVSPAKWSNGKAARSIDAGANVTISNLALTGTPTVYNVSGITAYSGGGLSRGGNLYYGRDDQLSLTLSNNATGAPLGYRYAGYSVSAGTLSGTTLTMPDANVTVSVDTEVLAPIDWATVNAGTQGDPYMIYNKDQLLLLAHRVNGTHGESDKTYSGKYFKLGADITFSYDPNEGNEYEENYEAIGRYVLGGYYYYFMGDFDGDGYTVSGIRIRKTGNYVDDEYLGLFGWIYNGANIHDVRLTDARIKGHREVGGIVGEIVSGTVSNCTVTESAITATNGHLTIGTICGKNTGGTLSHNYYYGCTVNGNAVTSGKGCYDTDVTENDGAVPFPALIDDADNTATITKYNSQTIPVVLEGRTLYKDGKWNTLCLPFNVDLTADGCPLAGATAQPLSSASISGSTLNLTFGGAVTTLTAGTPYIIKWASGDNIVDPVFSGVTIDATDRSYENGESGESGDTRVRFLGTYKSTTFADEDKSILFLGTGNKLYYPQPDIDTENPENSKYPSIGAQRAYFKIGEDGAGARQLTAFNIDFGNESTGIRSLNSLTPDPIPEQSSPTRSLSPKGEGSIYSLDGRKLSGKPTQKGMYIVNGKKVVIK